MKVLLLHKSLLYANQCLFYKENNALPSVVALMGESFAAVDVFLSSLFFFQGMVLGGRAL